MDRSERELERVLRYAEEHEPELTASRLTRATRARIWALAQAADAAEVAAALPNVEQLMSYMEFCDFHGLDRTDLRPSFEVYEEHFYDVTAVDENSTALRLNLVVHMLERVVRLRPDLRHFSLTESHESFEEFERPRTRSGTLPHLVSAYRACVYRWEVHYAYHVYRPAPLLPPAALEPTTERPIVEAEMEDFCTICFDTPAKVGLVVTVLPCVGHAGHWFHTHCILGWFEEVGQQQCPYRCEQRLAK